jgi:hypothetical protein
MKRTVLALISLSLALAVVLFIAASLGVVQAGQPVKDARPTPTPDRPIPDSEAIADPDIPPLPDLVVEKIEVEPASPRIGQMVTIKVTIANRGSRDVAPGNNFWADLYIDPAIVPIQLGQDGVAAWPCQSWFVPVDGSYILYTDTIVFDDVKTYALYAQVDTDGHVTEENENNNVFGPVQVEVRSARQFVHQTHEDFQMGVASSLDVSHPDGVIRRGIFEQPFTEPDVYSPDNQIDSPPLPEGPTYVNQVKPVLTSNENGVLYAAWEDGRHGGVFNRRIYAAYSLDDGVTWEPPENMPIAPDDGSIYNQVSVDLAFDPAIGLYGRLYAVWQDGRNGHFDIYSATVDVEADGSIDPNNWQVGTAPLNDDVGSAHQLNPAVAVRPSITDPNDARVYVVWQDQRNGNDDIYLVRSDDGGEHWGSNYFVTDDPHMTAQNQLAPAIGVEDKEGIVVVGWEDWRDPEHPEIYAMWSWDEGATFGVDVPVTIVEPEQRQTYRLAPDLLTHTTTEPTWVEDPETGELVPGDPTEITIIHVAWQDGKGENADVYWTYAYYDHDPEVESSCPWPYEQDFCFEGPAKVSGFVLDSDYVRPPNSEPSWPIEPTWQGQASLDLVPDGQDFFTFCKFGSTTVYSKGVVIAWSDSRSYDDWRYEIHTRRLASPGGDPKAYEICNDSTAGMVNGNPKLRAYRDDLGSTPARLSDEYNAFSPAAVGQLNPSVHVDPSGLFVAWDDDRWDDPFEPGTVRDRDIFVAKKGVKEYGIYISPVLDGGATEPRWYVLSWWGATQHEGDLVMQTRFGNTPQPPLNPAENAGTTWTRWTGNPSSEDLRLRCPGDDDECYYDAPGRHIVRPDGTDWFSAPDHPDQYRYMQYKVIIRRDESSVWNLFKTALSQVVIHYEGPNTVYLPLIIR